MKQFLSRIIENIKAHIWWFFHKNDVYILTPKGKALAHWIANHPHIPPEERLGKFEAYWERHQEELSKAWR